MIGLSLLLTILSFIGFLILVIFAFMPNQFIKLVGRLVSRDLTSDFQGIRSLNEDGLLDDDPNQSRTAVALIQTRR